MKILMTGTSGTIAPVVAQHLASKGHIVMPLDRDVVDIHEFDILKTYIEDAKPDWIMHIATGPITYATDLAKIAASNKIKYLYTSTVSIFDEKTQKGPYTPDDIPKPTTEYGIYKLDSEKALKSLLKDLWIIRLGWQIGITTSGNQMISYLKQKMLEHGVIEAPTTMYTACSFITDSAKAIEQIMTMPPGTYQCDANDGYSHYDVFDYLKTHHPWIRLKPIQTPPIDNRMTDARILIKKLSTYIKEVKHES